MLHRNAGAKLLIFWDMANFLCLFCRILFNFNENTDNNECDVFNIYTGVATICN